MMCVMKRVNNFFSSGFDFSENEYELKLHYYLYNSILAVVIVMLTILTTVRLLEENYFQAAVDAVFVLLAFISIYFLRQSQKYKQTITIILLSAFFVLVSISFINVNRSVVGASWFIVFLFPVFFLFGYRLGKVVAFLALASVSILSFIGEGAYTIFEYFYIMMPLLMSIIFIVIYEKRNSDAKLMLAVKNQFLEDEVERKTKAQLEIEERNRELAHVINDSSIELYIVDYETDYFLYVNKGALEKIGYSYEEMLEMTVYDINPSLTVAMVNQLKSTASTVKNIMNVTQHQKKDGTEYGVQSFIHQMVYDKKDAYVIFDIDISDKQRSEKELLRQKELYSYQAHYDALTDLPNRVLLLDRLTQAIYKSNRSMQSVALFFIDLDQFKQINDSYGHDVGDEVLKEVALRFKKFLRRGDTLARLGGDEFTVVMEQVNSVHIASTLAEKLIESLKHAILVNDKEFFVTCSIGISLYPEDADEPSILLRNADAAMYKAKDEGRNTYSFYTTDMTESAFQRLSMENDLKRAIKNNDFIVNYQAQYDANHNDIIGMEALIRWQHPDKGIISPNKFIPLAEENGMIVEIDRLMMRDAMEQHVQWYQAGLNPGTLSLNLSVKQLGKDDFLDILDHMLETTQCEARWLKLEVTEGQIMSDPDRAISILKKIHELGIGIAIDDFGTGYSSLSYLKKLPIDQLKIDQSFIRDIPDDEEDIAITKAIIVLAKSLQLDVIAEGVETEDQKAFLLQNGCIAMQGYLFAKPVSSREMQEKLINNS